MPSASDRALEKARTLAVDGIIFDLEDAVAPDAKEAAREKACAAVADPAYGRRELTIRVNGGDTRWHDDDLRAVAAAGPDAVVVPKVSSAAEVHRIEAALEAAGAPDRTAIWAMVETPRAMLHAEEIAGASERLTVLVMGTNDLAKELHATQVPGREPLLTGLGLCLLAARATGTAILDGVYNDVRDAEGFEAECLQGRRLGFDGKTLIHPGQVEPCNRAFAPTEAEVAEAQEMLRVFQEAVADGRGVVTFHGRMIENLHVENARRILDMAAAIEALV
jgi:citrate lyase subunit beta/citryl-CoA lyase